MKLKATFGHDKPIVAMVHLPPLPGSPLYDPKGGMQKIIDSCAKDIEALIAHAGTAARMFGKIWFE